MNMTVSQLASRTGISPDTVRFYERERLLPPPARSPAGYRLFDEGSIERVGFVRRAQDLGLRLREIRELLDISDRGTCPCGHTLELLKVRIADIDAEIERLTQLRSNLTGMLDSPPTPDCEAEWEWVCGPYMTARGGERP
ncbi:MAG: MerR family DNA-binding protein [Actinobacteria bacterium]|nr:MerR family DNA-binding protein [Actinomycetota bacterium]